MWTQAETKPTYTAPEVGLGNVANVRQYSADNPPPYPVTSVNGQVGSVNLPIPSEAADVGADPVGTAEAKIKTHNTDNAAHEYIQQRIDALRTLIENFLDIDDESFDQLSEILRDIRANTSALELLGTNKIDKTAISTSMTDSNPEHVASVTLIVALDNALTVVEQAIEDLKTNKQTAAQVSEAINNALSGYLTSVKAAELYQTKGDYALATEAVLTLPQTLTEAQKAQARANIGATAGEDVEYAESVEWLEANGDTSKKYVLPDGYIYTYTTQDVFVEHNANDGTGYLNFSPSGTWGNSTITRQGMWSSPLITFDPTTFGYGDKTQTAVIISGIDKVVPVYNNYAVVVYYYKQDGGQLYMKTNQDLASIGVSSGNEITLPLTFQLKDSNIFNDTNWVNVYGARITLGIDNSGVDIEANDVANLKVNIPFFDRTEAVPGWYSTGQQHSNDLATQQNSADIATLKERTDTLEADVAELKETVENGGLVDIQTGQVLYAVGDSITYGYGIGGNDYSWVKHVIDRNGYDSTNSLNLGQSNLGFCTNAMSGDSLTDVLERTDFSGADIVTVALGINDWKNANALLTDFWTGMENCFKKIRTDNPYCKIFYILPFNARFLGTFDTFWCLGAAGDSNTARPYAYTLQTFINMIKDKFEEDTFKAFRVHVIDMVECPAINRHNITSSNVMIDSIHPSAACHVELGKEISRRIAFA